MRFSKDLISFLEIIIAKITIRAAPTINKTSGIIILLKSNILSSVGYQVDISQMGTYLQLKENANIKSDIIFDGDQILYNPYSYLIVSPIKYPDRNNEFALLFLEFLLKNSTMELVSNYKIAGKVLFTPITSK